jgi:hypothetical protein
MYDDGMRWRPARQRPHIVSVTFTEHAGSLDTLEGAVSFAVGDAIVTGIKGECWPIPRHQFERFYTPCAGLCNGQPGNYQRQPRDVSVAQLGQPTRITLSEKRGTLVGETGDWLVEYAPGDRAIVAADIFQLTYELLAGTDLS